MGAAASLSQPMVQQLLAEYVSNSANLSDEELCHLLAARLREQGRGEGEGAGKGEGKEDAKEGDTQDASAPSPPVQHRPSALELGMASPLAVWLAKLKLKVVLPLFVNAGWTIETVLDRGLEKAQLDQLGVSAAAHRQKLTKESRSLQGAVMAAAAAGAEAALAAAAEVWMLVEAADAAVVLCESQRGAREESAREEAARDAMALEEALVWGCAVSKEAVAYAAAIAQSAGLGSMAAAIDAEYALSAALVATAKSKKKERALAEAAAEKEVEAKVARKLAKKAVKTAKSAGKRLAKIDHRARSVERALAAAAASAGAAAIAEAAQRDAHAAADAALEAAKQAHMDIERRRKAAEAAAVAAAAAMRAAADADDAAEIALREWRRANKFPMLRLRGDARQRGLRHGKVLRERIRETWVFYYELWTGPVYCVSDDELRKLAAEFEATLRGHHAFSEYATEIDAIAEGAELEPWKIFLLNARPEVCASMDIAEGAQQGPAEAEYCNPWAKYGGAQIRQRGKEHYDASHHTYFSGMTGIGECTALFSPKHALLAQNWDWAERAELLAVLVQIDRNDGHSILMVTEPGMLAKFGFNSAGVGVTHCSLQARERVGGVPVFVLVRAALDASSLCEAAGMVMMAPRQTAAALMLGDEKGSYHMLELYGPNIDSVVVGKELEPNTNVGEGHTFLQSHKNATTHAPLVVRTNHFLSSNALVHVCGGNDKLLWGDSIANSRARYDRAQAIIATTLESDLGVVRRILSDTKVTELANQEAGEHKTTQPIQQAYDQSDPTGMCIGTVCSVIFDLRERTMHITRGNPQEHPWEAIELSQSY